MERRAEVEAGVGVEVEVEVEIGVAGVARTGGSEEDIRMPILSILWPRPLSME